MTEPNWRERAEAAEFDASRLRREVADRTAERDEARAINAGYADQVVGFQEWLAREVAKIGAARSELEAFATTPIPAEFDSAAVMALTRTTVPFIERMRAALGGAQ